MIPRWGHPAWANAYNAKSCIVSIFDAHGQLLGHVLKCRLGHRAYGLNSQPLTDGYFATQREAIDAVAAAAPSPGERERAKMLRRAVRRRLTPSDIEHHGVERPRTWWNTALAELDHKSVPQDGPATLGATP
jgi:hypothetical protein